MAGISAAGNFFICKRGALAIALSPEKNKSVKMLRLRLHNSIVFNSGALRPDNTWHRSYLRLNENNHTNTLYWRQPVAQNAGYCRVLTKLIAAAEGFW